MIDFSQMDETLNFYGGSEKKKTIVYQNKKYLVKFPDPIREKKKNISYINNAFSEYIGSHIFQLIGMEAQNTILGEYHYQGKVKIVCACEDFNQSNMHLYEFENLALSTNLDKRVDSNISDIMEVLELNQDKFDKEEIVRDFFDMFIVDALIGNTDRHNGNWGFMVSEGTVLKFSPIYDCGSCLNPLYEDFELDQMDEAEIKNLALNCFSCLKENGKKIPYFSYIKDGSHCDCKMALLRVFPKINMELIHKFIDEISILSDGRREFYKKILGYRYGMLKSIYKSFLS